VNPFVDVKAKLDSVHGKNQIVAWKRKAEEFIPIGESLSKEIKLPTRHDHDLTYWVNPSDVAVSGLSRKIFVRFKGQNIGTFTYVPGKPTAYSIYAESGEAKKRQVLAVQRALPINDLGSNIQLMKENPPKKKSPEMWYHGAIHEALAEKANKQGAPTAYMQPASLFNPASKKGNPRIVFQQPLPIVASDKVVELGEGHADVIARVNRNGAGIALLEIKAPDSEPLWKASVQALTYAVCIRELLENKLTAGTMMRLLGYGPHSRPVKEIFAIAVLPEITKGKIENTKRILGELEIRVPATTSGIPVHAGYMEYERKMNGRKVAFTKNMDFKAFN